MKLMQISAILAGLIIAIAVAFIIFATTVQIPFTVEAKGRIEPKKILPIATEVNGYITEIARNGKISRGEIILKLDCKKLTEEKKETESMIDFLKKEKEKEKPPLGDYRRRYSISKELKNLENKLKTIKIQISSHCVKSQFDGVVMATNYKKGEYLKAGQEALLIADNSNFIFSGSIGQEAIKDLSNEQKVFLRLDSYPYMKYGEVKARVSRIDNLLRKDGSSTHKVFCTIQEKPDFKLVSGLKCTGRIVTFRGTIFNYLCK